MNKSLDEVYVYGEYTADCRIDGKAVVAGNQTARLEAFREVQKLLRTVIKMN